MIKWYVFSRTKHYFPRVLNDPLGQVQLNSDTIFFLFLFHSLTAVNWHCVQLGRGHHRDAQNGSTDIRSRNSSHTKCHIINANTLVFCLYSLISLTTATEPYFHSAACNALQRQLCSGKTSRQNAYALWSTIRIHFIPTSFHFTFQFSFCPWLPNISREMPLWSLAASPRGRDRDRCPIIIGRIMVHFHQ